MESANWLLRRSKRTAKKFWCRSAIPVQGFLRSTRTRSSTHFLQPSPTALAWGSASAVPSLNRMEDAYGLPRTLRAVQILISPYLRKSRQANKPSQRCSRHIKSLLIITATESHDVRMAPLYGVGYKATASAAAAQGGSYGSHSQSYGLQ